MGWFPGLAWKKLRLQGALLPEMDSIAEFSPDHSAAGSYAEF